MSTKSMAIVLLWCAKLPHLVHRRTSSKVHRAVSFQPAVLNSWNWFCTWTFRLTIPFVLWHKMRHAAFYESKRFFILKTNCCCSALFFSKQKMCSILTTAQIQRKDTNCFWKPHNWTWLLKNWTLVRNRRTWPKPNSNHSIDNIPIIWIYRRRLMRSLTNSNRWNLWRYIFSTRTVIYPMNLHFEMTFHRKRLVDSKVNELGCLWYNKRNLYRL